MRKKKQQKLIIEAINELKAGESSMSEKEQQLNDTKALKKAYIGNAVMLLVLGIGIVLAVFAWLTTYKDNSKAVGTKLRANDNLQISFITYSGTLLADGTVTYDRTRNLNDESSNFTPEYTVLPGEKYYFQTIISSDEPDDKLGDFTLLNLVVNKKLSDMAEYNKTHNIDEGVVLFKTTGVWAVDPSTAQLTNEIYGGQDSEHLVSGFPISGGSVAPGETAMVYIPTQRICRNIVVPSGGSIAVNWYFEVEGKYVGNSSSDTAKNLMGETLMDFQSMKFLVDATA